ncbi:MAG TPA: tetratricopeptide repeat protein [Candidatus Paceibacterota bacterium]|nr:tetratricopeptide repeat protein [Candidatus Paceibacterota bacterium]
MKTKLPYQCRAHRAITMSAFVTGFLVITLFSLAYPMQGAERDEVAIASSIEKALISEDWKTVSGQLSGVETNGASATLRLIKGHACLALNENNESFGLFLSVASKPDRAAYADWASSLAARNPENAIAWYFKGDALARQTNWNGAVGSFDQALKLNPKHALTLNARGVVFAQQGKVALAKKDFVEAVSASNGSLADAHDNVGYLWIQRKDGAKGALEAFKNAISHSSRFALALHGKGCIELVCGNYEDARQDLQAADGCGNQFARIFIENEARFAACGLGLKPDQLLAALADPGMSLSAKAELVDGAKRDFGVARNLEKMSYVPFNQHLSQFFDGMGMRKAARLDVDYGAGTARKELSSGDISRAVDYAGRQKSQNGSFMGDYAQNLLSTGKEGIPSSEGKIDRGGIAKSLIDRQISINNDWKDLNNRYSDIMQKSYGAEFSGGATRSREAGGVLVQVRIQNGNWPFLPFYGLAYTLED